MAAKRKLNILSETAENPLQPVAQGKFPKWLHRKLPQGDTLWKTQEILTTNRMPTVCEEARCPNLLECWSKKTATFLALGKECTRNCGFCSIDFAKHPKPLDPDEPQRLAQSVKQLGLKHVVITMVARDDLHDGGASHLAAIIEEVRNLNPSVTIEILTSDFEANEAALHHIIEMRPEVFNHNIETVRSLTPRVRHKATYERTLQVLSTIAKKGSPIRVKSGLMVGLGETTAEVEETIRDLYAAGCSIITIGQYLQPDRYKLKVKNFIHPDQFAAYSAFGTALGVKHMYCGPFVRSSYNAAAVFENTN